MLGRPASGRGARPASLASSPCDSPLYPSLSLRFQPEMQMLMLTVDWMS